MLDTSVQTDFPPAEAPANYPANYPAKPPVAQKFKHPALTKHPARARGLANCQIFGQICWFYANICKIISNILHQQVEKWKISNIFSFLVPQNLFAYLDIWPDVQDLLQYPAIYQRSGLRLGANQRSGSGQRSGILVSQRFGSGRRAKINLRLNTALLPSPVYLP